MLKAYIYYICKFFFRESERTFIEQIVSWIETVFKGSTDKVANFWGLVRVTTNLKHKEQRHKLSIDV